MKFYCARKSEKTEREKRGARGKVDGDCYNSYLVVQSFAEDPQRKTLFRLSSPEVVNDILSRPRHSVAQSLLSHDCANTDFRKSMGMKGEWKSA